MPRLEDLPADQKATLQLLLKQGKSYEELAALLRLDAAAVRDRALDALDALGPDAPADLSAELQDEVSDYLLGQQSASARAQTRSALEQSAGARAWARVVSGALRDLAGDALPEIPADGAEVHEAFDALDARRDATAGTERSSRLGGVLLLVGVGAAVAALLIFLISKGGDDSSSSDSASTGTTTAQTDTGATGPTGSTQPGVEQQINMKSPDSDTIAVGYVIQDPKTKNRVLGIVGQGFPSNSGKSFFYAVWLRPASGPPVRLGFVQDPVAKDGRLQTGADPSAIQGDKALQTALRKDLNGIYDFKQLLITRETARDPKTPGTVVVSGAITRPSTSG